MKENGKRDLEHRLTKVEVCVEELQKDMREMIVEHLPRLDKRIDKLEDKLSKIIWLLITNLIGLVIGMLYIIINYG